MPTLKEELEFVWEKIPCLYPNHFTRWVYVSGILRYRKGRKVPEIKSRLSRGLDALWRRLNGGKRAF